MKPILPERSAAQSAEVRRLHRDAWLIVLGIGCAIILFGNVLGIGPWWLASVLGLWMIAYGIFVQRTVDDADVPGDTKGDSIYYLGLLFTFAALVAALITFDWGAPGSGAGGTIGSIRNFGIALLTTIVGLAGRVWFTMSQESPGDLVDATRSELEETVARMKESLDRARDDLDIMAHKFRDSSAGLGKMAETIAQGTKKTAESYDALDEYAGCIASATQSLTREMDQLSAVCRASDGALTALQGQAHALGERFDAVRAGLDDHLGRAQSQLDIAEATLVRIGEAAGPAAERFDAIVRGVEGTDAVVSALGKTLSGVKRSADRAQDALAGIADAVDGHEVLPLWKEAVDQLHEGTRGIRGIGERATAMNAEFDGLMTSVKAASDGLARLPETAGTLLKEEVRKAAAAGEFVVPSGRPPVTRSDRIGQAKAALRRTTEGATAGARRATAGATAGAKRATAGARRATAGARRALTRLAGFRRRL